MLSLFTVNSTGDNTTVDEWTTLREAIYAANDNAGPDNIDFAPELAGQTITLGGNELVVSDDLTVTGLEKDQLMIDAGGKTRHFRVNPGIPLTISDLTLTNGNAGEGASGGSIYVDGSLAITDVELSSNYAAQDGGAIYASSFSTSVAIHDCLFSSNSAISNSVTNYGGGIRQVGGTLLIDATTFNLNSSDYGGGVYTAQPTQVANGSRFEDNTAMYDGGGVYASGMLTVADSDFLGNQSGNYGGGIKSDGLLTVNDSRFEENTSVRGGGILASNPVLALLSNVTFLKNTATVDGGAWFSNWYRPVQVNDCHFSENHADSSAGAMWVENSVQIEHSDFNDNTATWGGALAAQGTMIISACTFDGNQAINDGGAMNTWGANIIEDCTFADNSANLGGAINHWDQPLIVSSSEFENNTAGNVGGAIRNSGPGTFIDSQFRHNQAAGNGGALYVFNDDFITSMQRCLIEQNEAGTGGAGHGGAIWSNQRRLEIDGSTLQNNTADDNGGGIYVTEGLLALADCLVSGNTAVTLRGGGLWIGGNAELNLANTTVSGNSAYQAGGGIYLNSPKNTIRMVNTTITANRADSSGTTGQLGGGIYTATQTALLQNTIVAGNFYGVGTSVSEIQGLVLSESAHNIVGDAATAGGLIDGVNGNRVGVDPMLGPLQDNGGRSYTHALLADSPAINAGDNSLALAPDGEPLWFDQRGKEYDRLVGLHVDLGTYEYQTPGAEIHGRKWFDLDRDGVEDVNVWGMSIVTNGNFEQGSLGTGSYTSLYAGSTVLSGWQVEKSVDCIYETYSTPAEGKYFIDMNGSDKGKISQVLLTEPGRRYRVQFEIAGLATGNWGVKTLQISAAGQSSSFTFDTTGHSSIDMGWETRTWEFDAQASLTILAFESLGPNNWAGPAIDNVVVQPFGRDDVRIYLDQNDNQAFDAGEPLTFLRHDDPNTPADETGTYQFIGLPADTYVIREVLGEGLEQVAPAGLGSYTVTLAGLQSVTGKDFGNRWDGEIHGTKFNDLNGNGIRDRNPLPVDTPTVLMVIDVSDTCNRYSGFSVADQNGHSGANDVLDAEIFTMLQLQQELISLGWGNTARVGVAAFATDAVQLDLDPVAAGNQYFISPLADADTDGVTDLEEALRSLRPVPSGTSSGDTDFEAALQKNLQTLTAEPPPGDVVMYFTSDGLANNPWVLDDELEQLDALNVERFAYGFGDICDVSDLRRIDPYAKQMTSTVQIAEKIRARSRAGVGDGRWLEPGLPDVTIYLDANHNGQLDAGELSTLSLPDDPATTDVDETGWYAFTDLPIGPHRVREEVPSGWVPTAPLLPDYYNVDLRTGPIAMGYDFGNRRPFGSISGCKGIDLDRDGVFEADEPGQANVKFYLDLDDDGEYDENQGDRLVMTDANGLFTFSNLPAGTYIVRELVPDGFVQVVPASGQGIEIHVDTSEIVTGLLFVNQDNRGCIFGFKWVDLNGNGQYEETEPGLEGVRIYLNNGQETRTLSDDPATADVDETGMWEITDVVPGTYTVCEESPDGYNPGYPGSGGHTVTLPPLGRVGPFLFGNLPIAPVLGGWKYNDLNGNCQRDRNRLCGDHLVLVVDMSGSTQRNQFDGDPSGDMNADGTSDSILDGELAALIAVNQALIDRGYADLRISIVAFGNAGHILDMDPSTIDLDYTTTPSADADHNGVLDVEQILRSIKEDEIHEELTDYGAALQTVITVIQELEAEDEATMLFVSDGEPNNWNNYSDEVVTLQSMGVALSAFGAGRNATLITLKKIDPQAATFANPEELVELFFSYLPPGSGGSGSFPGSSDGRWAEPGVPNVIVYIDANNNGRLDWTDGNANGLWDDGEGERWTLTENDDPTTPDLDETGRYQFDGLAPGTYIVREIVPNGWIASPLKPYLTDDTLIHYFPFSGDTVDQISLEAIKSYGADAANDRFDQLNSSYFFDGYAFMRSVFSDLPVGSAPRTMVLWARRFDGEPDSQFEHLANWGATQSKRAFGFYDNWGNQWFGYMHGADIGAEVSADTDWHQLVLTYDGSTARLFVDGQEKNSATWVLDTAAGPLVVGTRQDLPAGYNFDGDIDDIRIYGRALADNEIADLYLWEKHKAVGGDAYIVQVGYGDEIDDVNFGNRRIEDQEVFSAAADDWTDEGLTLKRTSDGLLHLYRTGTTLDAVPPRVAAYVAEIQIAGRSVLADQLTIDYTGGNPIPSGGLDYDGGTGSSEDTLNFLGTSGNELVVLNSSQVTIAGSATIRYVHVAFFGFDLGTGTDSLLLDHATLKINRDNTISAGTDVTINGGSLDLNGYTNSLRNFVLQSGGIVNGSLYASSYQIQSGDVTATILGPGGLVKCTSGQATMANVTAPSVVVREGGLAASSIVAGTLIIGGAATHVWDGGGGNNNWSTAKNWNDNAVPLPGDNLVFPDNAARMNNINDFPSGTFFQEVTISGGQYTFQNNGLNAESVQVQGDASLTVASISSGTLSIGGGEKSRVEGAEGGVEGRESSVESSDLRSECSESRVESEMSRVESRESMVEDDGSGSVVGRGSSVVILPPTNNARPSKLDHRPTAIVTPAFYAIYAASNWERMVTVLFSAMEKGDSPVCATKKLGQSPEATEGGSPVFGNGERGQSHLCFAKKGTVLNKKLGQSPVDEAPWIQAHWMHDIAKSRAKQREVVGQTGILNAVDALFETM